MPNPLVAQLLEQLTLGAACPAAAHGADSVVFLRARAWLDTPAKTQLLAGLQSSSSNSGWRQKTLAVNQESRIFQPIRSSSK